MLMMQCAVNAEKKGISDKETKKIMGRITAGTRLWCFTDDILFLSWSYGRPLHRGKARQRLI